jgi:hypothetical protein
MTEITEIVFNERGDETHESWLLISAGNISSSMPGKHLFDSEIAHAHFVNVRIYRCSRRRELNRDYKYQTNLLLEMSMSAAQWGAFVSSFGRGSGVPATLEFLVGEGTIPEAPVENRLGESQREVKEAGTEALRSVTESYERVMDAFENGGKRALREALRDLGIRLENAPKNMEFAAESLTEHVENVTTKARADIEAMVLNAIESGELPEGSARTLLGSGDE